MIVSFRSKALERFWWKGETRRVDPRHVVRLRRILGELEIAGEPEDLDKPANHFHALSGDLAGRFSVRVDKNWRVTFAWSGLGADAVDVDYEDYY